MRVGTGYDSHRFDSSRPLVLGGIEIPGAPGLLGFSDGDAVAHAVSDALLGAAGEGDIGRHFPPGDERWRDADSMDLLGKVAGLLRGRRFRVVNVDVTVICETPKIGPFTSAMRTRIGAVLGIGPDDVSIKGKTNEGMGWIGSGEGVAVHAVALIKESTSSLSDESVEGSSPT